MNIQHITCYKLGGLCLKAAETLKREGRHTEAKEAEHIGKDLLDNGLTVEVTAMGLTRASSLIVTGRIG